MAVTSGSRVRHEAGTFTGERGLEIYHQAWLPLGVTRGSVVIAHGFAEHGGRYAYMAEKLVTAGYAVHAGDHRGHGRSAGKRTAVVRFTDYVADLRNIVAMARGDASLPAFLLGHSMGGLVALDLAVAHPGDIDALIVSAPLMSAGATSKATIAVGRLLSRFTPDLGVLRPPLQRISRDPKVVAAYNADPLVFRTKVRARLGAEIIAAIAMVDAALPAMRMPLLALQGSEDGLVDPGCAAHVFEHAGSPDKTLKTYAGLWHEIFNEPERDQVIADVVAWLDDHREARGSK